MNKQNRNKFIDTENILIAGGRVMGEKRGRD